ncbi:hypothetical protein GY45DRAFT_1409892 [Cubamyces sp. BRFM 1775]|nr:hypothetical protein GY45DRAFT_1409892 [Cubamyces sp. BRFM 1775]
MTQAPQASTRGPSALVIGVPGPSGAWPSNEAKVGHTVDLRRPWIPSPGIRAAAAIHVGVDVEERPARGEAPEVHEDEIEDGFEEARRREGVGRQVPPPSEPSRAASSSTSTSTRSSVQQPGSRKHRKQQRVRQEAQTAGDERPARPIGTTTPVNHARERPRSWLSCLHPRKLLKRSRSSLAAAAAPAPTEDDDIPATAAEPHERPSRRELTPSEWRAYGYWARPTLGPPWTLMVHNATPPEHPRELSPAEVDAMFAGLREHGGGEPYPERWVARVEHPSLPPRPDLWPTPRQAFDPLPRDVQLNPWLRHHVFGPPALHFDLRLRAADALLNRAPQDFDDGRRLPGPRAPFDLDGPDGAQPATFPGVPRLRIAILAGDPQPEFWWPVTVLAHHEALPVLVCDVLDALVANFEERMAVDEVRLLSEERRLMVYRAYARRTNLVVGGRPCPKDDGLRRVDYLGDNVCFRGLEPAPDGQGFVLFMGPPP